MRRGYLVSGMVQGVGFRYFTQRQARRIGVCGWVRNREDGRVEAIADGSEVQLEEFELVLRRGPGGASVTGVHASRILDEAGLLISFDVR